MVGLTSPSALDPPLSMKKPWQRIAGAASRPGDAESRPWMACGGESGMDACRAGEHSPVGTPLLPKPAHSFSHRDSASGPNHRPDFEQLREERPVQRLLQEAHAAGTAGEIGRASCRERVCQYV